MADGLLLRPDEVRGLDPEGLRFYGDASMPGYWISVGAEGFRGGYAVCGAGGRPSSGSRLSLADPATRDRVARWVAERVGLEVGATAPGPARCMSAERAGKRTGVMFRLGGLTWCDGADMDAGQGHHRDRVVPALAAIDPEDPQVDWLALAAVARYLGRTASGGV